MAKAKTTVEKAKIGLKIDSVKGGMRGIADPGVANPNQHAILYFGDASLEVNFNFSDGTCPVRFTAPDGTIITGEVVWDE